MKFFDSHAHYNDEKFDEDRVEVLDEIYKSGVTRVLNAGYSIKSSEKAVEMLKQYDFLYASVGVSPNDLEDVVGAHNCARVQI